MRSCRKIFEYSGSVRGSLWFLSESALATRVVTRLSTERPSGNITSLYTLRTFFRKHYFGLTISEKHFCNDFLSWYYLLQKVNSTSSLFYYINIHVYIHLILFFNLASTFILVCLFIVTYHGEVGKVWRSCCKVISKSHQATKWQVVS